MPSPSHFPVVRKSLHSPYYSFFFFNDTATTEIYTLSLHDALPISHASTDARVRVPAAVLVARRCRSPDAGSGRRGARSEEHTSELQSHSDLVCRLLLEKKKRKPIPTPSRRQLHRRREDATPHTGA